MTLKGSRTVATGGVEKRASGHRALHRPTPIREAAVGAAPIACRLILLVLCWRVSPAVPSLQTRLINVDSSADGCHHRTSVAACCLPRSISRTVPSRCRPPWCRGCRFRFASGRPGPRRHHPSRSFRRCRRRSPAQVRSCSSHRGRASRWPRSLPKSRRSYRPSENERVTSGK